MRKAFILVAAWLLSACAGRPSSIEPALAAATREVTAISAFTGTDLPPKYSRLHDEPGWKWVLWSHEQLCVVDSRTWASTHVGDQVSCDWRLPRG
ncbi:MAG TPA: hypothetical protein VG454_16035 [Gemmatimonadales bacterium]|nr:hypothetical protein [Gemmatimonadales bacterium]